MPLETLFLFPPSFPFSLFQSTENNPGHKTDNIPNVKERKKDNRCSLDKVKEITK